MSKTNSNSPYLNDGEVSLDYKKDFNMSLEKLAWYYGTWQPSVSALVYNFQQSSLVSPDIGEAWLKTPHRCSSKATASLNSSVKLTSATPNRRHAASNASSSCTHELMLLPSLEPLRRTGHLWRRESPSLLSTARGGTAARPAGLRARGPPVPTVVSPAEISEEEEGGGGGGRRRRRQSPLK